MPWFPVDDRFHSHPKAAAASLAALGLWTVAGSWVNEHHRDGDVPGHMISHLSRGATELADELVTVGLWRRTKTGYRFHQWHADQDGTHRNVSASELASVRQKKSIGGSLGNHRRWHLARDALDPDCLYCNGLPDRTTDRTTEGGTDRSPNPPTPPHTQRTKTSSPAAPTDDDPDWSAFWAAYPRRVRKATARKAWAKALSRTTVAEIIFGAKRYAAERRGQPEQYTAHPATWLNAEGWRDEPAKPTQPTMEGWWDN